jgi:RimJ/RimL family protein N-acetyltransferase
MDRQPILEGERLLLRPLAEEDADALVTVACDPLIWALHPMPERAQEEIYRPYLAQLLGNGGSLVIEIKETGAIVGSSTFANYRPGGCGAVEIGSTFLARTEWGGKTNREAKRLMLAHAFKYVGLVEFLVWTENLRSRRAMEKIGGRLTDRMIVGEHAGRSSPHCIYEITREQFSKGPLMA